MSDTHQLMKGDTRTPLGRVLMQGGRPVDLSSLAVKVLGYDSSGTAWIAETTTGVTAHPTTTFTVDTSLDKIKANGHKAKAGDQIVVSNSGGALPTGLSASTRYFVIDVEPNAFKVSLKPSGAAEDITAAGSGTHSFYIVGSVQYDFQTADVDTAGRFKLWFRVYDGSEYDTFPVADEAITVVIEEVG